MDVTMAIIPYKFTFNLVGEKIKNKNAIKMGSWEGGMNLDWPLVDLVGPEVLVLGGGAHDSAGLLRAEEGDAAVEEIDLIEEIDRVGGEPFVEVLALGERDGRADVTAAEGLLGLLVEFVSLRALLEMLPLLQRLGLIREDALLQHFKIFL